MNDLQVSWWPIDKPIPYARNSRKIPERAIDKVAASIQEFGWRQAIVVDKDGVIICGHTRLLAAKKLGLHEVPVHVADNLTPAQVKAYRLMDNRSHEETDWDLDLLGPELEELRDLDFDLELTGFDEHEIDDFLADPDDDRADQVPPVPEHPAARPGDVWVLGEHRLICGDATQADVVAKLLGTVKPLLMVTDPPYGISLDTEWRDRAGLNGSPVHGRPRTEGDKRRARNSELYKATPAYMRTEGHREVSISGDTIADWSHAFELVPSLQVVYVWHASVHTAEVVTGLQRIGFLYPQQIIWNKGRPVSDAHALLVRSRALLVCQKEERSVVRRAGQREHHHLGSQESEVHHGRIEGCRRQQTGPPDAEAGRTDAQADPESHQARRRRVRSIPRVGNHADRRGNDRARLLRHRA